MVDFVLSGFFAVVALIAAITGIFGFLYLISHSRKVREWLLLVPLFGVLCFLGYFGSSLDRSNQFLKTASKQNIKHHSEL